MDLEIHYAEEWAALYRDGELVTVGDSYVAEEQAFALLGVKTVHDDAFMRGQSHRDGVAKTIQEVTEYQEKRDAGILEAERLEAEARALEERAAALRAGKGGV